MSDISDIRPEHQTDNVLQFETPEKFDGRLWKYQAGHSVLVLRFSKNGDFLYAGFEMVWYVDLPIHWQGGNIKTAPEQECLALLTELNFFGEMSGDELEGFQKYTSAGMRLFLIDT